MADRIEKSATQRGLEELLTATYAARGIDRVRMFVSLALIGAWYGIWSPWGAIKILILGGVFGRGVQF